MSSQHPTSPAIQRCSLSLPSLRISCLRAGDAGAKVVVLHGGGADSASLSWSRAIGFLARRHQVYAPDLPGYGQSEKPKVRYSSEYYIDFLEQFWEELGRARVSLVGLSMGGLIALGFALKFPEQVGKLILVDSAGLGPDTPYRVLSNLVTRFPTLHEAVRKMAGRSREIIRLTLKNIVYNPAVITEELLEEVWLEVNAPGAGRAWRSFLESEIRWQGFRTHFLDRLSQLSPPTLLIHGEQDRLVSVEHSRRAKELIPNSRLHVFSACGHWPPRERPEEFNRIVNDFLVEK